MARIRRAGPRPTVWLLLLLAACGESETPPPPLPEGSRVTFDLLREMPAAEVRSEVARLDFGTAAARPLLTAGWGIDERDPRGAFVWGLGESSELELFAVGPVAVTLVLDCEPHAFPGAPPQTLRPVLNGHPLGELELAPGGGPYRVAVPADAVARGRNRLRFTYGAHHRPSEVNPSLRDERPLAVRWRSLELAGLGTGGPAISEGVDGEPADALELPAGAEVVHYLYLEAGSELIAGLDADDGARLRVEVELAGRGAAVVPATHHDGAARWSLSPDGGGIARLTLSAEHADDGGWQSWLSRRAIGLVLRRPVVVSPRGGPAPAAAAAAAATAVETPGGRPNVLIYLIDTLRADHLGVYGYDRPTSPNLDRFAEDAVVFTDARAQSSWTRTAVVSTLTGLYPKAHGVRGREDALAPSVATLAEVLRSAGYETAGFITNGNVSAGFALDQGFDSYRYLGESRQRTSVHQLSDRLNERVFRWLDLRAAGEAPPRPFFLYVHATDPHAPYTPPSPFRERFAAGVDPAVGSLERVRETFLGRAEAPAGTRQALIDLYDAEIAFNDHQLGALLDYLRRLELYDDTMIVLLSDHGEEFLDHGKWEHGKTLYVEQLHVPLIIKLPGSRAAGRRPASVARQIDVMPTVLDTLGLPPPPGLDGASLLPRLGDAVPAGDPASFAELSIGKLRLRSVADRGFKLIADASQHHRQPRLELYRVHGDPGESRELAAEHPLELGYLRQLLRRLDHAAAARHTTAETAEVSDELRQRLEALGYVD